MGDERNRFDLNELLVFLLAPLLIGIVTLISWLLSRSDAVFLTLSSFQVTAKFIGMILALIAVLFGGWQRFYTGISDAINRKITVNVFVTVAIFATVATGEFVPAAVIILIMAIVGSLEAYTLDKTRRSISSLLDLTPKTASIKKDGKEVTINVSDIKLGDIVVVRPGERIPVDGVVVDGEATVNQAPITGESMPVEKTKGDEVFAGTLNETGRLEVKTTKIGSDTTLAKIVHLVEEAQESKAPIQSVADKFTAWFLPVVLLIAIVAYFFSGNIKVAVSVLLVACPCAFAIATPSAVAAGIANMAKRAVLINGGIFFEIAGKINTLVIDKTGTLTFGKMKVVEIIGNENITEIDVLKIAAIAEKYSEHPLAKAVLNFAREKDIEIPDPENFKIEAGMGVEAKFNNNIIWVGREIYLKSKGIELGEIRKRAEEQLNSGRTVIYVAKNGTVLGFVALEDEIKPDTIRTVNSLRKLGLKIAMLTGDNKKAANSVAVKIGIDNVYAELLPHEKQYIVKELKNSGKIIGMVGDGINDAPALALADVGIVMGAAGTDIAIEAADVTLIDDNLIRIIEFIQMSRKVLRRIKMNIFFSIIYNVIGLSLAALGHLTPVFAVIFQEAGCVTVVMSSTLILFSKVKTEV
ncbi:MAG: cation-translocating P-type ATPase [bacterium]